MMRAMAASKEENKNLNDNTTIASSSDDYRYDPCGPWIVDEIYDVQKDRFAQEKHSQKQLQSRCSIYRNQCYYGPEDEIRTCIWSKGDNFSWKEKTSGISWIGVTGSRAAFVVTMNEKPRPPANTNELASTSVLFMALCDMGVWADTSSPYTEFRRQMIALTSSSKKVGPFAVVSIAPGTAAADNLGTSNEDSPAIKFLTEKLNGRSTLPYEKIKQIALCAMKYLVGSKFDPNKIEVMGSGWRDGEGPIEDSKFGAVEVEELLAAMDQI